MSKTPILPVDAEETEDDLYSGPSKSQKKRDSSALQDLGTELVALSPERLKKIDMPDNLRAAIADAQRFTRHEAKRRQLQLIGKIMRGVDPAPLQAVLDEVRGVSAAANARLHRLEQLRAGLMADEAAFNDLARDYPEADIQRLRQLRRNALKEAEQSRPPRAFRELFRELRELQEAAEKAARQGQDNDEADMLDGA